MRVTFERGTMEGALGWLDSVTGGQHPEHMSCIRISKERGSFVREAGGKSAGSWEN